MVSSDFFFLLDPCPHSLTLGDPDSDISSPDEWEENSMIASESEMGMTGSP